MADHSSAGPPWKTLLPYKLAGATINADGTVIRHRMPMVPPSSSTATFVTKDVALDPANNTYLRIFRPRVIDHHRDPLPILVYFHGGGFAHLSAATPPFHDACAALAVRLPAVVVSVEYRLAPEYRLPAAYDDALAALRWLSASSDDPLLRGASLRRCFLLGTSAGANIAYRAALRVLAGDASPRVIKIAGVVMNQPFFGGVERTESEARSEGDRFIPLPLNDLLWWLGLPAGADQDHVYCNPVVAAVKEEGLVRQLPRFLVIGFGGDPLIDRQKRFAEMLRDKGVNVEAHFLDGGYHCVDLYDTERREAVHDLLAAFVASAPAKPIMSSM